MKRKNDQMDFSVPARQSIIAIVIILIKFVRIIVRQAWPFLLIILFNPGKERNSYFTIFLAAISSLSLVGSIVAYFKFYFYIKDGELIIEKGVIRKTKLNIPFDRIQTINFEQNIIHQLFNVVSIQIDTAGSVQKEFSIDALEKDQAEAFRAFVMGEREKRLKALGVDEVVSNDVHEEAHSEKLLHLSPFDLLKVGVSQNHLKTAGIIMFFFFTLYTEIEDAIGEDVLTQIPEYLGVPLQSIGLFLLIFIPVFLLISFVITLFTSVLKYFDLTVWKTSKGLKIVSGLFTKKEKSVLAQKIQILQWSKNLIQNLFSIFTINIRQAASAQALNQTALTIPGSYQHHIDTLKNSFYPINAFENQTHHSISKLIIWRRVLFLGVLPSISIITSFYLADGTIRWEMGLWIILVGVLTYVYHSKYRLSINDNILQTRSGIFGYSFKLAELYKVQAFKISQSLYQKRKGIANVTIHTAAGTIKIPFLDINLAIQLQDYLMYKVEESTKKWM